jgi:hypothetical protein
MTKIDIHKMIASAISDASSLSEEVVFSKIQDLKFDSENEDESVLNFFNAAFEVCLDGDTLHDLLLKYNDVILDDDTPDMQDNLYSEIYEEAIENLCRYAEMDIGEIGSLMMPET